VHTFGCMCLRFLTISQQPVTMRAMMVNTLLLLCWCVHRAMDNRTLSCSACNMTSIYSLMIVAVVGTVTLPLMQAPLHWRVCMLHCAMPLLNEVMYLLRLSVYAFIMIAIILRNIVFTIWLVHISMQAAFAPNHIVSW